MQSTTIRFNSSNADFFSTLNKRVNEHFKTRSAKRWANREMIFKTCFMYGLYWIPYFVIISSVVTQPWLLLMLAAIMGIGIAGIGLSVMHDANHGAYSNKQWVNNFIGYSLNMVGGNAFNWRIQHNVLHHTYTNGHDVDEDISPRGIHCMPPHGEWKQIHRLQHVYAWFFYGLMTLVWVLVKDFVRIGKDHRDGVIKSQKTTVVREVASLVASKVLYFAYLIGLPLLVTDLSLGMLLIGFVVMHYVAGFILAIIFQPAHVVDGSEYPLPAEDGRMENSWAVHQLRTTTNFANENRILSWYVGGLNYQIEHHLFPNVCHVHYRAISQIVRSTAHEFGLPYKSIPTFTGALRAHARMLYDLGKKPAHA